MKKIILFLLAFTFLTGCQAAPAGEAVRDRSGVTVVMGPTSEPEAGFDPAFGWGAGEHVHEPLIQSTLTVTNPDLTIGYDLATAMESRCYHGGEGRTKMKQLHFGAVDWLVLLTAALALGGFVALNLAFPPSIVR